MVVRTEKIFGGKIVQYAAQAARGAHRGKYVCHPQGSNMSKIPFLTLDDVADFLRTNPGSGVRMNPGRRKSLIIFISTATLDDPPTELMVPDMSPRPPLPKKLAARIRGAQAKVIDARGWIEATEFNAVQDEARWTEFARNPEAFARKYYAGHAVDSYPVQTNTSRIREKLAKLPARRDRNRRELEEAEVLLARVEVEVMEEVRRMRPTSGRVDWPAPLEPYDQFFKRALAQAYEERNTSDARREAYLAEVQKEYDEEIAALDIQRQAELDELSEDMKSWTPAERAKFREVMGAIAEGLRTRTLSPSEIRNFTNGKVKR